MLLLTEADDCHCGGSLHGGIACCCREMCTVKCVTNHRAGGRSGTTEVRMAVSYYAGRTGTKDSLHPYVSPQLGGSCIYICSSYATHPSRSVSRASKTWRCLFAQATPQLEGPLRLHQPTTVRFGKEIKGHECLGE